MSTPLDGKVAIVTGSGQGVAKGIAIGLARAGAKVITNNRKPGDASMSTWMTGDEIEPLLDDTDRADIERLLGDARTTADQIVGEGGDAVPFFGDVSDLDTAEALVATALDTWGRVDILVNSAAGLGHGPFLKLTPEDWHYQTHAKLTGAYNTMHHTLPHMIEQGFGRVINVSSGAWIGVPDLAAYSAANAGLVAMTKAVATEVWGTGVTCNAICPSALSRSHVNFRAKMRKQLEGTGPEMDGVRAMLEHVEREHGPAEHLAPFLVYLASENGADVSAAVFDVTAGGRITLYSEFSKAAEIRKDGGPWTLDELASAAPEQLLAGLLTPNRRLGGA